ncbi:MAG: DNA primase [Lewinellaceae bacterium]|nr:DNA primase [Lewinellaceae bacterium]
MIPPKTVQDILETTRIEEVVEDFVALRKRGINLIGLCPFHNEKTPSFNVNPTRNIFKCFGCGKGGDAVTFLIEHEHFTYPEALRWLARKYGIEIEEVVRTPEQIAEQQITESLYIVNDFALQHFQEQLFDTDEGKSVALSYFKKRGLREETIRSFGLGYAPDIRDLLLRRAKATGHSIDLLQQLGLCSQDQNRDFFRGRVMFAIHNLSGKVTAFAGRTMSTEKTVPKYINSPETAIYVKNKILYGAFQAKKAIRQKDECILVEGYMDVISLHQEGIENVVASSGTSLTEGQLQLIKRNTGQLKILYDGDPAGIKAALRGLDLALEQDLNVKIVLLPEGEDPDSYVQKIGREAFQEYIDREAKDFILFKTELLLADTKGDPVKRAGLIKDIVGSIALIPDPIKRSVYLRECSGALEVSETALVEECNKLITQGLRKRADREARKPGAASDTPGVATHDFPSHEPMWEPPVEDGKDFKTLNNNEQEREIVKILIRYGDQNLTEEVSVAYFILSDIDESIDAFENDLYRMIVSECNERLSKNEMINADYFLNHESKRIKDLALDLLFDRFEGDYSSNWEEKLNMPLQYQKTIALNFDLATRSALNHFKKHKIANMMSINAERIKNAELNGDIDGFTNYVKIQMKLKEAAGRIAKLTGTVVL